MNTLRGLLSTKIIVIAAIVLLGLYIFSSYNGLVTINENVEAGWAQVETQYQRRFDLIPNLVSSVQGLMNQEQEVFKAIADARTKYAGATTQEEKVEGANQVESALGRLLVVMENYPQLQSSQAVQTLMAQLEGTENRISVERGRYNELVRDYNVEVKTFPKRLVALIFGFDPKPMFEAQAGSETAPKVELNN